MNFIEIICPDCGKGAMVKIPNHLFKKGTLNAIKIHIESGICCNHRFLAFVSNKHKAIGYEKLDSVVLNKTRTQKHIFSLKTILDNFNNQIVLLFFRALLLSCPIIIVSEQDLSVEINEYNYFFNSLLPEKHLNPFLFSYYSRENLKENMNEISLILTDDLSIEQIPWASIPFDIEKQFFLEGFQIMDRDGQIYVMKVKISTLFDKVIYLIDSLNRIIEIERRYNRKIYKLDENQNDRIFYEDECDKIIIKKYGENITKLELDLIRLIALNRFHANIQRNDNNSKKVKKIKLPQKKIKNLFKKL
ncbi:hypothetical protein NEF87_000545 [Candidatus Lokiarchaeum ossiferum]|uniref:Uncharacterized protein n=1 Tax=Candidatus Lokiarchaeum ossiferum TaxID=2951803 RepID=A0ABY6HL83_9ARCH|nr:hypothetical protein NEF87_000545 [Candidatus Lokiarchaeum sp. B-35]